MFTDFITQLHYIPQATILTILFAFVYLYIKEKKKQTIIQLKNLLREKKAVLTFLFYTALLLAGTIMGRPHTNPFTNVIGIIGIFNNGHIDYGSLFNIVMFIPYIFLFNLTFKPKKAFVYSLWLTITSSLFIELFQLLFWIGQFSVGDLFHNIIGGLTGYGLWCAFSGIKKSRKRS